MMSDYLNKSKINTYLSCPKRYYYEYVAKVEPTKTNEMILGEVFHKSTDLFYDKLKEKITDEDFVKKDLFEETMISIIGEENYKIPIFRKFIDYEYERYLDNNYDLTYYFPLYKETYFKCDELYFDGIIDRVFKMKNGRLKLQEIKTGNIPQYKSSYEGIRRELALYKLLLNKNNINIYYATVYYPKYSEEIEYEITNFDISKAIRTIILVRKSIEQKCFERREGFKCLTTCPFSNVCYKDKEKEKKEREDTLCGFLKYETKEEENGR